MTRFELTTGVQSVLGRPPIWEAAVDLFAVSGFRSALVQLCQQTLDL